MEGPGRPSHELRRGATPHRCGVCRRCGLLLPPPPLRSVLRWSVCAPPEIAAASDHDCTRLPSEGRAAHGPIGRRCCCCWPRCVGRAAPGAGASRCDWAAALSFFQRRSRRLGCSCRCCCASFRAALRSCGPHLVVQRLEDVHLSLDLSLLGLTHTVHVDLAPRYLDALLLVVPLVHRLERAMAQLLIELR